MALGAQPYIFGSGILWGVQQTDSNGGTIANPTPTRLGELQEMTVDFSAPIAELYGSYQNALALGRKAAKNTVKAKFARFDMGALNSLYFGEPSSPVVAGTSQVVIATDEGPTLIPATPFQITVTNSATFGQDLGVRFTGTAAGALAGTRLKAVASSPITGQYSVSAGGIYTFASADNVSGYSVIIDYQYAPSGGTNQTIVLNNHLLGAFPQFTAFGKAVYGATTQKFAFKFNQCVADKLSIPTKLDGFAIAEFDFSFFADSSNVLGALTGPYL